MQVHAAPVAEKKQETKKQKEDEPTLVETFVKLTSTYGKRSKSKVLLMQRGVTR
jgi:hypothetical protein